MEQMMPAVLGWREGITSRVLLALTPCALLPIRQPPSSTTRLVVVVVVVVVGLLLTHRSVVEAMLL
jgi:hypothetical protein